MASLLSPHRPGRMSTRQAPDVRLRATRAEDETDPEPESYGPRFGWQFLALGGALVSAVAGWVLVAGLTVVGWLSASPGDLSTTLHTGTRLWLLANGAPAQLGGVGWSLVPLGMSLLIAFMVSRFTRTAVRFAEAEDSDVVRVLLGAAGLATVGYAAVVAAVGLSTGADVVRGTVGAAVIAAVGAFWGAKRGAEIRFSDSWPEWSRSVPAAVAAAVGVLLLSGAVVLATGIVQHADRISTLTTGLGAGAVGGIALWAAQAAFAPNVVIWCASYALGAGFSIGQGSVVAPSDTSLGLLPSIPILGALPGSGPGTDLDLGWLASGVVAGAVAAVFVVRRRTGARPDETSLVGGLAGVLAGLVFTALAYATGGDLGDGRLAGAGPRMLPLLVMSCTLLGLSGMICGLIFGLVTLIRRAVARRAEAKTRAGEDHSETSRTNLPHEQRIRVAAAAGGVGVIPTATSTKTPAETPSKASAETNAKTSSKTPAEPNAETSSKTAAEPSDKTPTNTPAEPSDKTSSKTPAETNAKIAAGRSAKSPAETVAKSPFGPPAKSPFGPPGKTSVRTPDRTLTRTPDEASGRTPAAASGRKPAKDPTRVRAETSTRTHAWTPSENSATTPLGTSAETSTRTAGTSAQTFSWALGQTFSWTPAKTSANIPAETSASAATETSAALTEPIARTEPERDEESEDTVARKRPPA